MTEDEFMAAVEETAARIAAHPVPAPDHWSAEPSEPMAGRDHDIDGQAWKDEA